MARIPLEQLAARFNALGIRIDGRVGEAVTTVAEFMAERARDNAPVATGALRDSITVAPAAAEGRGIHTAQITARTPYALQVHERPPSEDQRHQAEHTPEGHRGRKYFSRVVAVHSGRLRDEVADAASSVLREEGR